MHMTVLYTYKGSHPLHFPAGILRALTAIERGGLRLEIWILEQPAIADRSELRMICPVILQDWDDYT